MCGALRLGTALSPHSTFLPPKVWSLSSSKEGTTPGAVGGEGGREHEVLGPQVPWVSPPEPASPTSPAHRREPMPGRGGPRGDPPAEGVRVVCHSVQGAHAGVPRGLRAPVLPAHPQQAAEIRLPVHGRHVGRGGGGQKLGVRLPPVLLSPRRWPRQPGRSGGAATSDPSRFRVKQRKLERKRREY